MKPIQTDLPVRTPCHNRPSPVSSFSTCVPRAFEAPIQRNSIPGRRKGFFPCAQMLGFDAESLRSRRYPDFAGSPACLGFDSELLQSLPVKP